jgi:hypothetical protein
MAKVDNSFVEDGRAYASAEPCHWGMIPMPPPPPRNWLEGLRTYRARQFEPHTFPKVSVDA